MSPARLALSARTALLLFALPLVALPASAGDEPRARVTWVDSAPVLDGKLDDPAWQQAQDVYDEFVMVYPDEGAEPTQRTEVRIVTDGKTLYFGVRNHDTEPDGMVINRGLRDDFLFLDDRFNIVLDTFHDHRNGYFFQINPVGVRRDALLEGSNFEQNWDGIWYAETTIDEGGWTAEIAIPYQSIAFDPDGDVWGLNFVRGIRRVGESDRWADAVRHRFESNLCCAGTLHGMKGITQGIGLDVVPGMTIRYTTQGDDGLRGTTGFDDTDFEPTFDAFYRVTPSLTTSLSVNTDFGDTEADEQRVDLTRFALFFPEKRDFFLRDALLFDFGGLSTVGADPNGRAFFSRRIGLEDDVTAAAKVTGRVGEYNIGILDAQLTGESDNLFVARISRNLFEESRAGIIVTNGDPDVSGNNTVVGADFEFRDSNWRGSGQVVTSNLWFQNSFTSRGEGFDGAWGAEVAYPNDRWFLRARYKELKPDFDPGLGFVNRRDIRWYELFARSRIWPGTVVRNYDHAITGTLVTNRKNRIDSGLVDVRLLEITNNQIDLLRLTYRHVFERLTGKFDLLPQRRGPMGMLIEPVLRLNPGKYHWNEGEIHFETSANRSLRLLGTFVGGSYYNGERLGMKGVFEWRPSWHFFLSFEYDHTELWLDETFVGWGGPLPKDPERHSRARTRVVRVRVNFQFTPNIAWTTFAQYDNISDSAGVNSRLRWIVEDGSEFFLVFNQGLHLVDDPLRSNGNSLRPAITQVIGKVGWTFRF